MRELDGCDEKRTLIEPIYALQMWPATRVGRAERAPHRRPIAEGRREGIERGEAIFVLSSPPPPLRRSVPAADAATIEMTMMTSAKILFFVVIKKK